MSDADIAALKERAKRVWGLGDYSDIARVTVQAAQPLVDACAVSAGQDVLDVAAGNGNVALAAAREGAHVVAADITPAMVELGRARSVREGLSVEWVEADVEELPFADESFDCVVSAFGAMLAPRPAVAAREAFRVLRPGGTFGMTAWTPTSLIPSQSALVGRYLPPPAGVPAPGEWGDPETARERLAGLAASVEIESHAAEWIGASAEEYVTTLEQNAGPQIAARQALSPDRYSELRAELLELVRGFAAGDGAVTITLDYLLVIARKRG